jgi:DNA-binding NarL/FixJ family response regulator
MEAVVVDLDMDEVTADAVLEAFQRRDVSPGLVFFNGSAESAVQRKYRRLGADSYLSEKSGPGQVARATRRAINRAG